MKTVKVVSAAIVCAGRLLLGKRSKDYPYPGFWCTPGGKVEDGETHAEALRRELLEELGVDLPPDLSIGGPPVYVHIFVSGDFMIAVTCYRIDAMALIGEPSAKDGLDEIEWFDAKSLKGLYDSRRLIRADQAQFYNLLALITDAEGSVLESLRGLAARESQPAPQVSTSPPIWPALIAQTEPGAALIEKNGDGRVLRGLAESMRARMERGLVHYKMPLRAHNGRNPIDDCQEEVLDALAYAEQARQEGRCGHELVNELFAMAYKIEKMRLEAADK